jgi:hypothetical protein
VPGDGDRSEASRIAQAILKLTSNLPATTELASQRPGARAHELVVAASGKAAAISGAMALPPGPLGLALMIPDLLAVWRLQAQLVSDIAATFGKRGALTREHMLYCMFRHGAAHLMRDLLDRAGERLVVRRAPMRLIGRVARRVGLRVSRRWLAKAVARWLPVVGALGVAGYAYWDTTQVGRSTIELFEAEDSAPPSPAT